MKYIVCILIIATAISITAYIIFYNPTHELLIQEIEHVELSKKFIKKIRNLKGIPEQTINKYIDLRTQLAQEFIDHRYSSRTKDYWQDPAGQQIIALGKKVLPFIMLEIERGDFFFNVAAREITGIAMQKENEFASEQEYAIRWAAWWKKNKNNPEWNIYLKIK